MPKPANAKTCLVKRLIVGGTVLLWASHLVLPAQAVRPFQVQWSKSFGGTNDQWAWRVAMAPDSGSLVTAGGGPDAWVLRLDARGNKLWERYLGGTMGDALWDVKATSDGGWILVGDSASGVSGNKTSPNYGASDYWVIRMDDQGNTLWDRSFGGSSYDWEPFAIETGDGGFLVVGTSRSETNEIKTVPSFGSSDIWLLKVSSQGDLLWQKAFGGTFLEWPYAIARLGTNGFVIGGTSLSQAGGNKETPNYGGEDFWIIAVDRDGNKLWERSYGGDGRDELLNIRETFDGGVVACGWSGSGVSGNKATPLAFPNSLDCWIIRLDAAGDKIWERTVGHEETDVPRGLVQTIDGGFVVGGSSFWTKRWMVRLDGNGNTVWDNYFNVDPDNGFGDIQSAPDGGVIAVGSTRSASEGANVLVMKFGPDALTAPELELLHPTGTPRRLILRGIPSRTYVTEGTQDLLTWVPFATNVLSSNAVELLDEAGGSAKRFYRAMMLP